MVPEGKEEAGKGQIGGEIPSKWSCHPNPIGKNSELERKGRTYDLGCWYRNKCWLQPEEHTLGEVIVLIILEQFLTDLGASAQQWVKKHQPKMVEEALKLAEDYVITEAKGDSHKRECHGPSYVLSQAEGGQKGKRSEIVRAPSREFCNGEP